MSLSQVTVSEWPGECCMLYDIKLSAFVTPPFVISQDNISWPFEYMLRLSVPLCCDSSLSCIFKHSVTVFMFTCTCQRHSCCSCQCTPDGSQHVASLLYSLLPHFPFHNLMLMHNQPKIHQCIDLFSYSYVQFYSLHLHCCLFENLILV